MNGSEFGPRLYRLCNGMSSPLDLGLVPDVGVQRRFRSSFVSSTAAGWRTGRERNIRMAEMSNESASSRTLSCMSSQTHSNDRGGRGLRLLSIGTVTPATRKPILMQSQMAAVYEDCPLYLF